MYASPSSGSRPSPIQVSGNGGGSNGGGGGSNDGQRMRTTFAQPSSTYNKPLPNTQFRQYPPGPNPASLSRRAVSGFQTSLNNNNNNNNALPLNDNGMSAQQVQQPRTPIYSSSFGSPFETGQAPPQTSRSQPQNSYGQDNYYSQQDHHYQQQQQQQQPLYHPPPPSRGARSNQGRYTDGGSGRYDNRGDDQQQPQQRMYGNNVATPSDGGHSGRNVTGYDDRQHAYDFAPQADNDYGPMPSGPSSQHHRTGSGFGGNGERVSTTQMLRQMSQVAGDVATCVHQNELVISLLERLVALSESLASGAHASTQSVHNAPSSFQGPTPPNATHAGHSTNHSLVGSTPGNTNAFQNPSPSSQQQQQQQQQQQPQQQQQHYAQHVSTANTHQTSSSSGLTPHSVDPNLTRRSSVHADVDMLRSNEQAVNTTDTSQQAQAVLQNTNSGHAANGQSADIVQNAEDLSRQVPSHQEDDNAFQALGEAFDDPLNFIATPASTTHHQTERTMPMSSSARSTQQHSSMLQAPDFDGHVGSGATPHSGPPRYDNPSQSANEIGGQSNRIPSPVFSESVAAGDDSFPSFDLSVDLAPRRGSRRISLRNAALQRQHLQQTNQRDAHSNVLDNQHSVSYSVPAPSEPSGGLDNASRTNGQVQQQHDVLRAPESEPSPKSVPVVRKKGTRGRKRKAILGRDSLRSNPQYPSPGEASADGSHSVRANDMTMQEAGYDDSAWADWIEPRAPPAAAVRNLPSAKYKSIKEVRMERKQKTNRSLATIGRIPLKQYLEVGGDAEYRAVRRLARTVYNTWLEPNVRLAKQDPHRLTACFHRIEYAFPILGDCEGHWKARELMLQVIDNAIDEVAFQKRKEARLSGNDVNAAPARRGRKPKPRPVVEPVQEPKRRKLSEPEEEEAYDDEDDDDDDDDDDDLDDYDDLDDDDDDDDSDDSADDDEEDVLHGGQRHNGLSHSADQSNGAAAIRRRRAYTTGNDADRRADEVAVERSVEALDPSIANISMSGNSLWNAGVGGRLYTSSSNSTSTGVGAHPSTTNQHLYSDNALQQQHPTQNDQRADWSAARDALLEASAAEADRNNQFANRNYSRRTGGNSGMMAW